MLLNAIVMRPLYCEAGDITIEASDIIIEAGNCGFRFVENAIQYVFRLPNVLRSNMSDRSKRNGTNMCGSPDSYHQYASGWSQASSQTSRKTPANFSVIHNTLVRPKQVIDLTHDDDKDNNGHDDDITEVSWLRNTRTARYHITLTPILMLREADEHLDHASREGGRPAPTTPLW